MRGYEKPRTAVSRAVIALRESLGMTQQQFSNAVEKTLGTIAVWETSKPPRGEALLDLAEFAWRNQHAALSRVFWLLLLYEVIPRLHGPTFFRTSFDGAVWEICARLDVGE